VKKLSLTLLGGLDIRTSDSHPVEIANRKERALLAWLAMRAGQEISREKAADILWGERPQKQANASLSQAIYAIRKVLAKHDCDVLSADAGCIMLDAARVSVDAVEFSQLAQTGDGDSLAQAAGLYVGPFLEGMTSPTAEFEEWLGTERRRLKDEALDALSNLLTMGAGHEAETEYAATARHLLALDPFSDQATRALMRHHAAREQVGAAIEAFDHLQRTLRAELGTEPSGETRELHTQILRRDIAPPENRREPSELAASRRAGRLRWMPRLRGVAALAIICLIAVTGLVYLSSRHDHGLAPVRSETMVHELPAKPSIAVMAFEDLSQGKDRDYLSDAIAEGIITQLSLFPELFVIARNSSFHYRDKNMDVRGVARELGVRYILEGSQQKSAHRLRVTVQLIDAVGGNHVWSRTFNRDLSDILVVQDEISTSVASSLGEKLSKIAGEEAKKANPEELRAYQNVLKANRYLCEMTKESTKKATQAYQAALASDPNLASAHDGMAWIYINGYRFGWTDLDRRAALAKAREEAAIGLQLAPDDYGSHFATAATLMQAGKREQAIVEFEKSLELNPNAGDVMATFAEQLGYAGRFEEAVTWLKKAMRLDPHHPDWFYWNLGWAEYSMGKCAEALETMRHMSNPPPYANRTLAAIYVCLGRQAEARKAIGALLAFEPDYSLRKFKLNFKGKYARSADLKAWMADLRQAGLPN